MNLRKVIFLIVGTCATWALAFGTIGCSDRDFLKRGEKIANKSNKSGNADDRDDSTSSNNKEFFEKTVLPALENDCAGCHDNPAPDYKSAIKLVVAGKPGSSELYLKATGQGGHTDMWDKTSEEAENLAMWINSL